MLERISYMVGDAVAGGSRRLALAAALALGVLAHSGAAWAQLLPVTLTVEPAVLEEGAGTVDVLIVASVEAPVSGGTVLIGPIALDAAAARDLEMVGYFPSTVGGRHITSGRPTLALRNGEIRTEAVLRFRVPFGEDGEGEETITLSVPVSNNSRYMASADLAITIADTQPTPGEIRIEQKLVKLVINPDSYERDLDWRWGYGNSDISSVHFAAGGEHYELRQLTLTRNRWGTDVYSVEIAFDAGGFPNDAIFRFTYHEEYEEEETVVDLAVRDAYLEDSGRRLRWGHNLRYYSDRQQGNRVAYGPMPEVIEHDWFTLELVRTAPDRTAPRILGVDMDLPTPSGSWYRLNETITFGVVFDEPVTVTSEPGSTYVRMLLGGAARNASLTSTGLSATQLFEYTVGDEEDADGVVIAENSFVGTVEDASGNSVENPLHAHDQNTHRRMVDGVSPTRVGNVVFNSPPNGGDTFNPSARDVIQLTVTFSEDVSVAGPVASGTFYVPFQIGTEERRANYDASATASTPSKADLVFSYVLAAADSAPSGIALAADDDIVVPAGVSIVDRAGNTPASAALDLTEIPADSTRKVVASGSPSALRPVTLTVQPTRIEESEGTVDIRIAASVESPVSGGTVTIGPLLLDTAHASDLEIVGYFAVPDRASMSTGAPVFGIESTKTEGDVYVRVRVPYGESGEGEETITLSVPVSGNPRYVASSDLTITIADSQPTAGETRLTRKLMKLGRDSNAASSQWPGSNSVLSSSVFGDDSGNHRIDRFVIQRDGNGDVNRVQLELDRSGHTQQSLPADTLFRFTYGARGSEDVVDLAVSDAFIGNAPTSYEWSPRAALNTEAWQGNKAYLGDLPNLTDGEWFTLEWVRMPPDPSVPRIDSIALNGPRNTGQWFARDDAIRVTVTFTEPVTVTSDVAATHFGITFGQQVHNATLTTTGRLTAHRFEYTVRDAVERNGLSIAANSFTGTVENATGNSVTNPRHVGVPANPELKVDGVLPTRVGNIAFNLPPDGGATFNPNTRDVIQLTVNFSEEVTMVGTMAPGTFYVPFQIGTAERRALYDPSATESTPSRTDLVFSYTLAPEDSAPLGIALAADDDIVIPGNIIFVDQAGNELADSAWDLDAIARDGRRRVVASGAQPAPLPVTLTVRPASVKEGAGTVDILIVASVEAPVSGSAVVVGPVTLREVDLPDLQIVGHFPVPNQWRGQSVRPGPPTFRIEPTEVEDQIFLRVRVPHGESGEAEETITLSTPVSGNSGYTVAGGLGIRIVDTAPVPGETRIMQKLVKLHSTSQDGTKRLRWLSSFAFSSPTFSDGSGDYELSAIELPMDGSGDVISTQLKFRQSGIPADTLFRFTYDDGGTERVVDLAVDAAHHYSNRARVVWGGGFAYSWKDPNLGRAVYPGTLPNVSANEWFTLEWVRVLNSTPPHIDSITFDRGGGYYDRWLKSNEAIGVTVIFDEPVTVTSTPADTHVSIMVGTETRHATLTSTGRLTKHTFRYTAGAEEDIDGISFPTNPFTGVVADASGNAVTNPTYGPGTHESTLKVDGVPPTRVGNVVFNAPLDGGDTFNPNAHHVIQLTVTFSEDVSVNASFADDTFYIPFQIGTAERRANYDPNATAGTPSGADLVFSYMLAAEDSAPNGIALAADDDIVIPDWASIVDRAGNVLGSIALDLVEIPADPTKKVVASGSLQEPLRVTLTVQPVTLTEGEGDVDVRVVASVGAPVADRAVVVGPLAVDPVHAQDLTISRESTIRIDVGETESIAVLTMQVPFGEFGEGEETITISAPVSGNPRYVASTNLAVTIADTRPVHAETRLWQTLMRLDGTSGHWGDRLVWPHSSSYVSNMFFVNGDDMSELRKVVFFQGDNGTVRELVWTFSQGRPSSDMLLRFTYGADRRSVDLAVRDAYLDLNDNYDYRLHWGFDPSHNIDLFQGPKAYMGELPNVSQNEWFTVDWIQVGEDSVAPGIEEVTIADPTDGDGWFKRNDTVTVTVKFDEPVIVTTDPAASYVRLTAGVAARYATLTSTGRSFSHTFEYTIGNDEDLDGLSIAANSFTGAVEDAAGNFTMNPTHAEVAPNATQKVDSTLPTRVGNAAFSLPDGGGDTFNPNARDIIQLTVTFNEDVFVRGSAIADTIYVPFEIGAAERRASYDAVATAGTPSTADLVFSYVLAAADAAPHGIALAADDDIVVPAGMSIVDRAGNVPVAAALDLAEIPADYTKRVVPSGPAWVSLPVTLTAEPGSVPEGEGTVDVRVVASVDSSVVGSDVVIGPLAVDAVDEQDLQIVGYFSAPDQATITTGPPIIRIGSTETESEVFIRLRVPFGDNSEGEETITLSAPVRDNARYADNASLAITIVDTWPRHGETRITRKVMRLEAKPETATGDRLLWPYGNSKMSSLDFDVDVNTSSLQKFLLVRDEHGDVIDSTFTFSEPGLSTDMLLRFTYGTEPTTVDLAVSDAFIDSLGRRIHWGPDADAHSSLSQGNKAYTGDLPNVPEDEWFTVELLRVAPDSIAPSIDNIAVADPTSAGEWFKLNDTITVTVTFDEPVTVTSDPAATHVGITVGAEVRNAVLASTGRLAVHTFEYTVAADEDADGLSIAANSFTGEVEDAAGNSATNPTHAAVAADDGQKVDGVVPARVGNATFNQPPNSPDTFDPNTPDVIQLTVTFSEEVAVVGPIADDTFYVPFQIGAAEQRAHYDAAATASTPSGADLVFSYTLVTADHAPHGIALAADDDVVIPAGVTIVDRAGNVPADAALDLAEILPDSTRKVGDVDASFGTKTIDQQQWHRDERVELELPTVETGNSPVTYTITGTLPAGLIFQAAAVEGDSGVDYLGSFPAILGAPTTELVSGATFSYKATDHDGDIAPALTFTAGVATLPPTNLRAIPGRYQFRLEWDAPEIADTTNVEISGYRIERYTSDSSDFPEEPLVADTMSTDTIFIDTSYGSTEVDAGVTATYRVRAISNGGVSLPTDTATTPPVTDEAVPAAIADLAASVTGPQTVALSWTAPDTNGVTITGYTVQRATVVSPPESADWTTVTPTVDNTGDDWTATDTDNALRAATTYHYRVTAAGAYGPAPYSDSVSIETAAAGTPSAPT